jgi:antitoxin ParD1/3/4
MGRNTSIILGEHFDQFIKSEIASGRYSSASEVIRSALRVLEDERRKIELLNEALVLGENSGKAKPFDNSTFKEKMRNRVIENE